MKYEIIFSGIGGQGVILAGSLLGEAAVSCGLRAAQTQATGYPQGVYQDRCYHFR